MDAPSPTRESATNRRAFIGSVAGGLLAAQGTAFGQSASKVPRIGVLGNTDASAWDGFRQGMRDLGYVDGRNVAIDWRWANGIAAKYPELATELLQLKVDLLVTSSTPATLAAKQATRSVPIVMLNSAYPDKIGLVESLSHPGGNVTGFSNVTTELGGKRLELLREIAPGVSRLALLWNPDNPVEVIGHRESLANAAAVGVELLSIEVRSPSDHAAAFDAVVAGRANALHANGNPVNFKNFQLIVDFALGRRLPSSFEERNFVAAGGLLSYAPSYADTYRRGAVYVDKILKGAKPGDLPIQQPTRFEFVINLKTAQALGLSVPRSLQLRADEVIQ